MTRQKMLDNVGGLGLQGFGMGGGRTLLGVAIGGGAAAVTSIGLSHWGSGKTQTNSDILGLGVGLATAGALAISRKTRHLAVPATFGAFLAAGLAWLNRIVFGTVQLPAATAAAAAQVAAANPAAPGMSGLGIATTRALNGLGISRTRQLGISTTSQRSTPAGTIPGVAGPRMTGGGGGPPVNLMGAPSPAAVQLMGMGGPGVHGIAGHWGSTHFQK